MNKIQSNELRVGNVLLYKVHDELAEPKTQWVMHRIDHEDIALCHHSNEYFNDHYRAVELTEDVLMNVCGFESKIIYDSLLQFSKKINGLGTMEVQSTGDMFVLVYLDGVEIKHLHQLQNIFFALNNFQELPIKLEP